MKTGNSQREIAELIGIHPSTLSSELRRNSGLRRYRHQQAQRFADKRKLDSRIPHKMTCARWQQIEVLIRLEWSPEQIAGRLEKEE